VTETASRAAADPAAWLPHEPALLALGGGTVLALCARGAAGQAVTAEVGAATLLYAAAVVLLRPRGPATAQKIRLAAAYGFILWFYLAVGRIVPALYVPARDSLLRAADEALFGTMPALLLQAYAFPALTDLLSLCYLSYLVYLHLALLHALAGPVAAARRFAGYVFTAFAVGLAGYLVVPAVGPGRAFPELFPSPLAGGVLTQANAAVVAWGSSVYDVFPSLHLLVTCVLLDHDRRAVPVRFRCMLLPAVGLVVSTLYLRYHYAVDLLAGLALFLVLRPALAPWTNAGAVVASHQPDAPARDAT
jgi:hypothetical protein